MREKDALGKLAGILTEHNMYQKQVSDSSKEMEVALKKFSTSFKNMNAEAISEHSIMWDRYFQRLGWQIEKAQENMERIRPQLQEKQNEVLQTQRDRRVMELLRDKEREQYMRNLQKKQRQELNEINYRNNKHNLNYLLDMNIRKIKL